MRTGYRKLRMMAVLALFSLVSLPVAAQVSLSPKAATVEEILNTGAFANATFTRGTELLQSGNVITAIPMLELAINRAPDKIIYRQTLAEAYMGMQTETSVAMALEQFTTVLQQSPDNRKAMAGLVQSAILLNRPVLAIETLEGQFLNSGSVPDMSVLTDLAALYLSANMADRGIATLNRALPKAQDPVAILLMLASFHQMKGEMGAVTSTLETARAYIAPGSAAEAMLVNLKKRWRIEE